MVKAENLARLAPKVAVEEMEEDGEEEDQDEPEFLRLGAHWKQLHEVMTVREDEKLTIMEIFSPGRFAELAAGFGFKSMGSFDLSDGWDWKKPIHPRRAGQILQLSPPEVLVMTSMWSIEPTSSYASSGSPPRPRSCHTRTRNGKSDGAVVSQVGQSTAGAWQALSF